MHSPAVEATPPKITPESYQGRKDFADLFAAKADLGSPPRGGPEEKVQYFRAKLKSTEKKLGRVRQAWEVREAELDAVETLLERARQAHAQTVKERIQPLQEKVSKLEAFIAAKKKEFEAYGEKVKQALHEREAVARKRNQQVKQLDSELQRHRHELEKRDDTITRMSRAMEKHREAIKEAEKKAPSEQQRARENEADLSVHLQQTQMELEILRNHAQETEREMERLRMALRAEIAKSQGR